MADHDQYMRLYVGDYLADTVHLSAEESGAYLHLIMHAFKQGGRLSSEPVQLARIARVTPRRWPAVWGMIGRYFEIDGDDLIQRRAKVEADRARAAVEAARRGGRASADARAIRRSTPVQPPFNSSSTAVQVESNVSSTAVEIQLQPNRNDRAVSFSGSDLDPIPRRSDPDQTRSNASASLGVPHARPMVYLAAATPAFLDVFDRYPRKDGKNPAAQVFAELAAAHPGGEVALSREILAAFDAGMLARPPYNGPNRTRPMLDTMLADRRWEDPPSAPDDAPPTRKAVPFAVASEQRREADAIDRAAAILLDQPKRPRPVNPRAEYSARQAAKSQREAVAAKAET